MSKPIPLDGAPVPSALEHPVSSTFPAAATPLDLSAERGRASFNPPPVQRPRTGAATDRILHVPHDERIFFDVYIRKTDLDQATYICTRSKISANTSGAALVASTICSRTDGERP